MGLDPKFLPSRLLDKIEPEKKRSAKAVEQAVQQSVDTGAKLQKFIISGERELQQQLLGYLRVRNIFPISPAFGKKTRIVVGCPDILFAFRGCACAWEVKFDKGKTSPEQDRVMAQMTATPNGWRVAVIRSVEEGKKFLDDLEILLA